MLNSGNFGSPQARRRVFMLSTMNEKNLPLGDKDSTSIKSILDDRVNRKYYIDALDKYKIKTNGYRVIKSNIRKTEIINYTSFNSEKYIYDSNYTGPTLNASGANSRIKFLYNGKIRKINPREAYRYMGFNEEDYDKVKKLNLLNDNEIMFTCGNYISVEILEKIFEEMFYK